MEVQQFNHWLWLAILLLTAVLVLLIGRWALVSVRSAARTARETSAEAAERRKVLWRLACQQADVIDSVITELASRPATYATFPPEIQAELAAAHDAARGVTERSLY